MKINVELNAMQMIEGQIDKQYIKCDGEIISLEKGTIIKFKDSEINYQITILKEKILIDRNGQKMVFELGQKTKSSINTVYGNMDIELFTKSKEIVKKQERITSIILEYEIELEEQITYQNKVDINLSY